MQWLNRIVDELIRDNPEGDLVVSSGVSPSGTYHLGTLREVLTAEAVANVARSRGRKIKHIHVVDDLDVFRKVPANVSKSFEQYLGKPLCDVPAPDGSEQTYADYYLSDLLVASDKMQLNLEILRANEKYREGFFVDVIESALENVDAIKSILETISGHKVGEEWSPIQVIEDGYLKNRTFVSINKKDKTLRFKDIKGKEQVINYKNGEVKLNWRIDWPARWSLLGVNVEPFGRDHATKGGSYDTGSEIVKRVYDSPPPLPVPYNFINRTGATKKMSKSSGDVITASELLELLPPEVLWYFILRSPPDKQLFFDEGDSLIRLVDDFGALLAKDVKSEEDKQLLQLCLHGVPQPTISRVPFSHLVASYQAALKNPENTLEIIARTEYSNVVVEEAEIIKAELKFIDAWLDKKAPEEVKFELRDSINAAEFSATEKKLFSVLADKIANAPKDAKGEWFHLAIYEQKDSLGMQPKEMFTALYRLIIGKDYGPRAGWFMSILSRDWLIRRLKLLG